METYKVMYGDRSATAYPEENWNGSGYYRYFYVSLDKDPGIGSQHFPHIARSQLTFIDEQPPRGYLVSSDGRKHFTE